MKQTGQLGQSIGILLGHKNKLLGPQAQEFVLSQYTYNRDKRDVGQTRFWEGSLTALTPPNFLEALKHSEDGPR